MFAPTRGEARRFLSDAWNKFRAGQPLSTLEQRVVDIVSLHLAVAEQLAIDQPRGLRAQFDRLRAAHGEHDALHAVLDCLGETMWQAQRMNAPPDGEAYLECVRKK